MAEDPMTADRDRLGRGEGEPQLSEYQRRLDLVMAHSHDGISLRAVSPDTGSHRIVMCNARCVEMSGYTREQLMATGDARKLTDIVSLEADFKEKKDKGLPRSGVSSWHRPDGRENYYEWNCCPILIDGKEHIIGIDRDITERIIAERNSEEHCRRLDMLMQHSFDGINICTIDFKTGNRRLVMCNDRYVEMSGYARAELMAAPNLSELTEAVEPHADMVARMQSGVPCRGLSTWKRPDGKENYHEWTAAPIGIDGKMHVIGIDRDVTDRICSERALRDANEKLTSIIDFLPDPTFVIDCDKRVVAWNRAMVDLTGVNKESILGKGDYAYGVPFYGYPRPILIDLIGRDDPQTEAKYEYVKREGDTLFVENWVPFGGDGQPAHRWAIASPIFDSRGEMIGAIESIRDNTDWLEAVAKIEANEGAERNFRKSLQDLHEINMELTKAQSPWELVRKSVELGCSKLGFDRLGIWFATDEPRTFSGSFGVDEHGSLRDERGHRLTVKEDRLLLNVLSQQLPVGIAEEGELLDHRLRVVGKGTRALAPLWDGERVIGFVSADNLFSQEPLSTQKTEILRLFALSLGHLYTRRQTERALRHGRDFANTLIQTAQVLIVVADTEGRIVRMNPFAEQATGYKLEEVEGEDISAHLLPEFDADQPKGTFSAATKTSGIGGRLTSIVTKDGQTRQVEWHDEYIKDAEGSRVGLIAIGLDVTERKAVEEELRQSQKMEAIGRLAGGIAHDFNNQLTVIKGYSDLLLRDFDEGSAIHDYVEEIRKAAEQAESMTSQLLSFGRRQLLNPQVVDLNEVLSDMSNALKRLIGGRVQLRVEQAPGLGNVSVDPTQIRQAIMNLVVNAWDAMPKGGWLTIKAENADVSEEDAARHSGAKPGPHVLLSVLDTGTGMDEQTVRNAFEPFFTTKPPGKGTGLGLPMVYGFAQQSGGHVVLNSETGKGTSFRIYLPRVEADTSKPVRRSDREDKLRGKETVLIAEDDQSIRKLVGGFLRKNGYSVIEAVNGRQALEAARRHSGQIDALVTDVVMPVMSGSVLADEVDKLYPGIPILFITGYSEKLALKRTLKDGAGELLRKPFSPTELGRAVRNLLDKAATQTD